MISVISHLRGSWEVCSSSEGSRNTTAMETNVWRAAWLHTSEADLQSGDRIWTCPIVYSYWLPVCVAPTALGSSSNNSFHTLCNSIHHCAPWLSFISSLEDKTWACQNREGGRREVELKPDPHCSPWERSWTKPDFGGERSRSEIQATALPATRPPLSSFLCLALPLSGRFIVDPGPVCLLTERKCKVGSFETLGNATGRPEGEIKYDR